MMVLMFGASVASAYQIFCYTHRYTPEIPEPASSLFRHRARLGSLWVLLVIKTTTAYQVHMSLHLLPYEWEDKTHIKRRIACKIMDAFVLRLFFLVLGWQKPDNP